MAGVDSTVWTQPGRLWPASRRKRSIASIPNTADGSRIELRRKLVHMVPALIPLVMLLVPHDDPLPWWNLGVVVAVVAGLTLQAARRPAAVRRTHEASWLVTCGIYTIAPTATLILFPANAEFAGVVLIVLAIGDGAASLAGTLLGRARLPWNPAKSWAGMVGFVLCSLPVAAIYYLAEARPAVGLEEAVVCAGMATLTAALAETLPLRGNDNLRVGLAAAVGVVAASALFFRP